MRLAEKGVKRVPSRIENAQRPRVQGLSAVMPRKNVLNILNLHKINVFWGTPYMISCP
jgi:hypothetical protein